jgi:AAA family ATP:ADP antiporter
MSVRSLSPRPKPNVVERLLLLFTEVRGGEGATVLQLALNVFLIFFAYYIIKPVREALIVPVKITLFGKLFEGAEIGSYLSAAQALLLLLVAVPLYARLAAAVPRRRLLNVVNLFFIANLLLFYMAMVTFGEGPTTLAVLFFIWVGIFNLMVPAQFWSLANDIYTPAEGKRLFVIVAFGASMGAAAGGKVTVWLIEPLGINQLFLVSAGVLGFATVLTNIVDARERRRATRRAATQPQTVEEPFSKEGAFRLVLRTRYLLLMAFLILIVNWVNTNGEFILRGAVMETYEAAATEELGPSASAEDIEQRVRVQAGSFYADFYSWVNIIGVVVQLLLVSRILKYLGVRVAILILPIIALTGYTLLAFVPILSVIRWVKIAENATDYSLQNTVRQALFLPTTREQKYKAKQAIDTFFWRAGDVLSAVLVYLGLNWLRLSTQGFALVNIVLVLLWIVLGVAIGKEYQRRTAERR